jgi:hypothetical protein
MFRLIAMLTQSGGRPLEADAGLPREADAIGIGAELLGIAIGGERREHHHVAGLEVDPAERGLLVEDPRQVIDGSAVAEKIVGHLGPARLRHHLGFRPRRSSSQATPVARLPPSASLPIRKNTPEQIVAPSDPFILRHGAMEDGEQWDCA